MSQAKAVPDNKKPSLRASLKTVFTDRQVLAMLLLGLASGLPFVVVGGTLNAWFVTTKIDLAVIGVLSWATLAYAFKFMWASALQSHRTPFKLNVGPRRFWMFLFLALVTVGIFSISQFDPTNVTSLKRLAVLCVVIAVLSASFDMVLAGWRIEVARDDLHLDVLSVVEQFGYRTGSLIVGGGSLIFAQHFGWALTFMGAAGLLVFAGIGIVLAEPVQGKQSTTRNQIRQGANLPPRIRNMAIIVILIAWGCAFYLLGDFMMAVIDDPENNSSRQFIRKQGPIVIALTVLSLGVIAALLTWLNGRSNLEQESKTTPPQQSGVLDILYIAILEPMMELVGRLKWAVLIILPLALSYRFTDTIWGSHAYAFYMGENFGALGHSLTEVGLASKTIGVIATILGVLVGGLAMMKFGRMPILVIGAFIAAITNFLFMDLALEAHYMDAFLGFTHLGDVYGYFHIDHKLGRLITAIAAENVAVGLASAASVAYLSSIVNKEYAVVQYALLVSLVFLLGVLGRGAIGEVIQEEGFARAFLLCAWMGGVAVVFATLEWIRQAKLARS